MRLIDADALEKDLRHEYEQAYQKFHAAKREDEKTEYGAASVAWLQAIFRVRDAPTIACAPEQRRERWDDSGRFTFLNGESAVRCSGCGACLSEEEYKKNVWNFCPVCGAKMGDGNE